MAKERRCVYDYCRQGQFLFRIGHVHILEADHPMMDHSHGTMTEFTYLEKGSQTYSVSGKDYTVNQGEVFVAYPEEVHSTGYSLTEVSSLYYFIIDLSCISSMRLFVSDEEADHIAHYWKHADQRIFKASCGLSGALKRLLRCFSEEGFYFHTEIRNALSQVLIALTTPSDMGNRGCSDAFGRSLAYIREHLTDPIRVEELPGLENMSLSSYHRKFVQITGLSPAEYILRMKIEKAKELLAATDMSVTEIAFRYGFSSSQYFATVFKRLCCSTPTQYRRMRKKMPDAFGHGPEAT